MKKGKEKNSKKTPENQMDEQNNNLYHTKQTVTFDGFLVYEKVTEEEENFLKMNEDQSIEPRLKEWLMMQHNSNIIERATQTAIWDRSTAIGCAISSHTAIR